MNILEMLIGVAKLCLILIVENDNKLVLQTTLLFVFAANHMIRMKQSPNWLPLSLKSICIYCSLLWGSIHSFLGPKTTLLAAPRNSCSETLIKNLCYVL
jgi:hypothetical protein